MRSWFLLCLLLALAPGSLRADRADDYIRSPRLGIAHISGPGDALDPQRYEQALALGAGWNRWPLYWDRVESAPGEFVWGDYDWLVTRDLQFGLSIDAILLGRPAFYQDGARISGLQQPIYADGSDTPRPGKALNPDNPWVRFVQRAVERYRPGGELARELGWPAGQGIRVWEIWNEPDFELFWGASIRDYARLLKTAYLVIKQADPEAVVMFGGLLYGGQDNWLARVLAIFEDDPFHEQHNWYLDAVAVHNYSYPWRSGWLVKWIAQTLKAYKLKRPIWMNESGVPVWDDYPGPIWATASDQRQLRATSAQQASFFIQSTAYAWAEGADVVFFHQLYDDCGNQPAGTDFLFHRGELCRGDAVCSGDAFGLFRNPRGAVCFSHHPRPGTPRPSARAFQLMAELFGQGSLTAPSISEVDGRATIIHFDRPDDGQRLFVIWNTALYDLNLRLPVGLKPIEQYTLDRRDQLRPDAEGYIELALPAAVCDFFPFLRPQDQTAIGGSPVILAVPLAALDDLPADSAPEILTPRPNDRPRCPQPAVRSEAGG